MVKVVLACLIVASVAHADNPKLAGARAAIDAVNYDEAQRLLVDALHAGGNSPGELVEIYQLSASVAVVLDQAETAERYYRHWLALVPTATLPADTSPKLREPFVAAQAYMGAHGKLSATVARITPAQLEVTVTSDPLEMAVSIGWAGDRTSVASLTPDHRSRIDSLSQTRVAVRDEFGNDLLVLDARLRDELVQPSPPPPKPEVHASHGWVKWAVPSVLFGLTASGFGIAALALSSDADKKATSSTGFFSDVEHEVKEARTFGWLAAGALAVGIGFGIPAFLGFRDSHPTAVFPSLGAGSVGLVLTGGF